MADDRLSLLPICCLLGQWKCRGVQTGEGFLRAAACALLLQVGDFGLRQLVPLPPDSPFASFVAPEVHKGHPFTDKADMYSIGSVLAVAAAHATVAHHANATPVTAALPATAGAPPHAAVFAAFRATAVHFAAAVAALHAAPPPHSPAVAGAAPFVGDAGVLADAAPSVAFSADSSEADSDVVPDAGGALVAAAPDAAAVVAAAAAWGRGANRLSPPAAPGSI